jgi:CBS-domain-containing membrane protein
MRLSFHKFKEHSPHLYIQPGLAVLYVAFILFLLSLVDSKATLLWAIGVGALSSSSYIVFVTPQAPVARSRRILGGYFVGITTGLIVHLILSKIYTLMPENSYFHASHLFWMSAAITVGLSMLMMIIFSVEHPPAVGVSLVLVLNLDGYMTLFLIFIGAIILSCIKWLLRKWLINLI